MLRRCPSCASTCAAGAGRSASSSRASTRARPTPSWPPIAPDFPVFEVRAAARDLPGRNVPRLCAVTAVAARPPADDPEAGGRLGTGGSCRRPWPCSSCSAPCALLNALPWDRPVTDFLVELRTPWLDTVVRKISFLGSTRVVILVAGLAALASWRRCPRLALAIVVIALARPLIEFTFKEIVDRPRPAGDRLVAGQRAVVPERPPAGHRRELVPAPAGRRALHARAGGSGGRCRSRCGRSPSWSPPAACGSACTGPPTWSRRLRSRCWASPWPSGSSRPPTAPVERAGHAVDSRLRTSTSRWSRVQSSRQPRNWRRLLSSSAGHEARLVDRRRLTAAGRPRDRS